MSILNELELFRPAHKGSFCHPVNHRRQVFVDALKKQIRMIDGEDVGGRKWWREEGGKVVSCLRYATDVLEVQEGTHFTVSSLDELKETYEGIIDTVMKGELDEILESHWQKSSFNRENRNIN